MKQSQNEIDQMIQRARPKNRDLVRRDINQCLNSSISNLILKLVEYYYNDGTSKELLCLAGTVACQYKGNRYNIPIEIWFQQDHPNVPPLAYVKPTPDMYVSPASKDVQSDGTIIISYLKNWRHAMSDAFSQSPPVYSNSSMANRSTPYPTSASSMPTPIGMPMTNSGNPSYSYPYGYPQTQIPQDIYRDSVQTAVLDKVRVRLDETMQIGKAEIDSLKKTEQDLIDGEKRIQSYINDAQQQQIQAQNYITNMKAKTNEILEATQKMSSSSSGKGNSVKEDALITPAPVYKQLLQSYAEEHAIQDLLYYLADGLRRKSIGLDTYLKHVKELSRKQFILRATMHKCRQVAGLPLK
ncbi:unnamed protein product [Rotaria sp. Silwood2]|nr:unnamed protein product [Rotaria sp. Silwood2]CAF4487790.1 unnamed protein product [Rotaria sp. Silwood2]CAF4545188.1 unnamed protein product [Rotaria sp. Silwood2]CAF4560421.1 unnamed protein product [Rotaria sp. Silwood2]